METQKAIVYRENGLWFAKTQDNQSHTILDQHPFHAVLTVGRDENREVIVEVHDGPGGNKADFKKFL